MDSHSSKLPTAKVYKTTSTGSAVRTSGSVQTLASSTSMTTKPVSGNALPPLKLDPRKAESCERG